MAFVSAGRKAFLDALQKATPIVLEPIMRLEITAPASAIGDITGDLATKRARINGNNSLPGQRATLLALVPLAEVAEYQSRLKALTGGQGAYTMELSHYDPVPLAQAVRTRPGLAAARRGRVRRSAQLCAAQRHTISRLPLYPRARRA